MPLGAITPGAAANNAKGAQGAPQFMDKIAIVGPASYTTGGDTGFDAALATALGKVGVNVLDIISGDCGDHYVVYKDAGGGTLMVFLRSTGAEAAGAANLAGSTFNLSVVYQ